MVNIEYVRKYCTRFTIIRHLRAVNKAKPVSKKIPS